MYDQQYLIDLINNKVEENLNLDYKGAASLGRDDKSRNELSKDVSAFANSDGGVIIYGIREDSDIKHLPISIEPLDRKVISKEWIEQFLQGNIQPRINDITIHPIEIDGDVSKVVYLLYIPKSTTAHQASDKKYYKRFNFKSEAMYDYEIRDILNRSKNPIIEIEFEVEVLNPNTNPTYHLKAYARNVGTVLANYINVHINIPERCLESDFIPARESNKPYFADNTVRDLVDVKMDGLHARSIYGPSRYDPLLPQMRMHLDDNIPQLQQYYSDAEYYLSWIVYADNAEPIEGKMNTNAISVHFRR